MVGTAKRTKSITIVISDTLICSSIENAPQPQTCSNLKEGHYLFLRVRNGKDEG